MANELTITGFEQIKANLIGHGFEWKEPNFTKTQVQNHIVNLNGQNLRGETKTEVRIEYLGEGAVDDEPRWGFALIINGNHECDIWASDWEDLNKLMNGK